MADKISIVVPVYGVEEYLDICIQSIVNQSYKCLEIILIDDASPDRCPQICDHWAKADNRVKVFHIKNGGVSHARNVGLQNATGNYVAFIDGDDYLPSKCLETVVELLSANPADLFCWNHFRVFGEKEVKATKIFDGNVPVLDVKCAVISGWKAKYSLGYNIRAVWGKLFDLNIIRKFNIRFDEELYIGEDAVFILEYLKYVNTVVTSNIYGYAYRINDVSATRRYKTDLLKQNERELNALREKIDNSEYLETALCSFCWNIFRLLVQNGQAGYESGLLTSKEKYREATQWYDKHCAYLKNSRAMWEYTPNFSRLFYKLSLFLPTNGLCVACEIFVRIRNRRR